MLTATIDGSVPSAAAAQISQLVSEIDRRPIGSALLVPNATAATMPSVVFATDDHGKVILAGIGAGSAVTLSADSTALALTRALIDNVPAPVQEPDVQAAIRASASYAALVGQIAGELAAGRSPADSTNVASAALTVISEVGVQVGATPARSNVSEPRAHALAGTDAPKVVRGPMPFPIIDYAPTCTIPEVNCWRRLLLAGADATDATIQNGLPIAWALKTETPTGDLLQDAIVTGAEDAIPSRADMKVQQILGNGVRFNLTVYQNEASLQQSLTSVVIDILKAGLLPLGAWVPSSRQCFVPLADIVLTETALAHKLASSSASSGIDTTLSEYFTEQKLTELAEPIKGALACAGAAVEAKAAANYLVSNTLWGKAVLKALQALGRTYSVAQSVGTLATAAFRYYATLAEVDTRETIQLCVAPNAGVVNCPVRYELAPASSTQTVGAQFALTVNAFDSDNAPTVPPLNLTWSSDNQAIVVPTSPTGSFQAVAAGTTALHVVDPFLPLAGASSSVTVQPAPPTHPLAYVTVLGKVQASQFGAVDCAGLFITPVLTAEGSVDTSNPDGNIGNLPFRLNFTIDPAKGVVQNNPTYSSISTPDLDTAPVALAPLASVTLTIAGRTVDFTNSGAATVSARAAVSKDQIGAWPAGYATYSYNLYGGARAGSNIAVLVADSVFLSIFNAGLDFTLPYFYSFGSANARQSAGFNIYDTSSNNHGCGTRAAAGQLLVESVSVVR